MDYTTISVDRKTKERFEKLGRKGQSWDNLLNEILDILERKKDE